MGYVCMYSVGWKGLNGEMRWMNKPNEHKDVRGRGKDSFLLVMYVFPYV